MKRSIAFLVLVILLARGAIGAMSGPAAAQGYYPPQPQAVAVNPWVGNNTPWTFYKGDWFLNGVLQYFFGPRYGFAPYYAYPTVYIVRPENWYAPGWNSWYQGHPQYWSNFERQYPYWRGHQVGHVYDQNFYNQYHRGQGGGWNQGFQGNRAPGATGPGYHGQGTSGPGYHGQGTTGSGYGGPGSTGPGYRGPATTAPGYHPSGTAGPGVHGPVTPGPGGHPAAVPGPGGHPSGAPGPAVRPKAPAPGGGTPGKTPPPPHEEKHQQ